MIYDAYFRNSYVCNIKTIHKKATINFCGYQMNVPVMDICFSHETSPLVEEKLDLEVEAMDRIKQAQIDVSLTRTWNLHYRLFP